MIINGKQLLLAEPVTPMLEYKAVHKESGLSYGLTECGYDIRIKQDVWLFPFKRFALGSSIEKFRMPNYLMGRVLNKSTWARRGLDASLTTNIEPGWIGYLTIELCYHGYLPIKIRAGSPICQIIFEQINEPANYKGKYQNQENKPVEAKYVK